MSNFINWFVRSSVNPEEVSMTVRGFLIAGIPTILTLFKVSCGIHLACFEIDETSLKGFIDVVANITLAGMTIVGGVQFVYGFIRKLALTIHK